MSVQRKVWSLWPSIAVMAKDLNESVRVLIEQRERGELPDARHDEALVTRAMMLNKPLTIPDLREERKKGGVAQQIASRQETIVKFYEAAGGVKALMQEVGADRRNYLDLAKARGYLPRARKYEFMRVAERIGFDLPSEIFLPVR